ncbi:MAG: hypothetical protein K0B07_01185 [DPANN group archaeon]|nr:hypothetical protein [DPANN group archaeon]
MTKTSPASKFKAPKNVVKNTVKKSLFKNKVKSKQLYSEESYIHKKRESVIPSSITDELNDRNIYNPVPSEINNLRQLEVRLVKNENAIIAGLPWIQTNVRNIMKVIAKYDRVSEQYLNSQFEKFEMYSKSIELDIESKINDNTNILEIALNQINDFIDGQKNLKHLEIEDNINNHKHMNADLNLIKEELTRLINQYKMLEKEITNIKKITESELKEEKINILEFVKELKGDIINLDKVLTSEKQKIEKAIIEVIDAHKKEFNYKLESNINISKEYIDTTINPLSKQIDTIYTKNNQFVKLINENKKRFADIIENKIENNIKISKAYMNSTITPLLKQIDAISIKDNYLVELIDENKKDLEAKLESNINTSKEYIDITIMPLLKQIDTISIKENKLVTLIDSHKKGLDAKLESNIRLSKEHMDTIKKHMDTTITPLLKQIDTISTKDNDLVKLIDNNKKDLESKLKSNIEISKAYVDTTINPLLKQIDTISTKNDQLVKLIVENKESFTNTIENKIEENLKVSKKYIDVIKADMDTTITPLLKQIDYISTKNNQLVKLIDKNKEELSHDRLGSFKLLLEDIKTELNTLKNTQKLNDSKMMDYIKVIETVQKSESNESSELINRIKSIEYTQASKTNDTEPLDRINSRINLIEASKANDTELLNRIDALEVTQRSNEELIKNAVNIIKNNNAEQSNVKNDEFIHLLEVYKERDAEREKRVSNMLMRIEHAVTEINKKTANVTGDMGKNINDELDDMISELKRLQQESN